MRRRVKKYEPTSKVYTEDDYPSSITSSEGLEYDKPIQGTTKINLREFTEEKAKGEDTKEFSSLASYIPNSNGMDS
jgi:hypothetical protein